MNRTLTDEDTDAIALTIVEKLQGTASALSEGIRAPFVASLRETMRLTGFASTSSFHGWARTNGLRSLRGARGRYSVDAIKVAIELANRRWGR
jgi:hypothetical protein